MTQATACVIFLLPPWYVAHETFLYTSEIRISMTENGDPLENAIAERINGIVKEEYLNHYQTHTLTEAKKQLLKVINLYNNDRPHMSIGNITPNKLHNNQKLNPQRLWKNYFKKRNTFENNNENHPVNLSQDLSINM
jgi:putative transposase